MKNSKYYLVAVNGLTGQTLKLPNGEEKEEDFLKDISMFDLITMEKAKEEFIKYISSYNKGVTINPETDLFVVRVANSKENFVTLHSYELLFNYPLPERLDLLKSKLYLGLKKEALERLSKINNPKARSISLKKDLDFKNYAKMIIRNITSNSASFTTHFNFETCVCLDSQLLKQLIDYKDFKEAMMLKELQSYKKLRGLVMEYLSYLNKTPFDKVKAKQRINYYYPKTIFGFKNNDEKITINEVRKIFKESALQSKLMSPQETEAYLTTEMINQLNQIKQQPFDNPLLERVYYSVKNREEDGLAAIMGQMDANDIYESSPEDLLRIGYYSDEQYLEIKKQSSSKKRI